MPNGVNEFWIIIVMLATIPKEGSLLDVDYLRVCA